MTKLTAAWTGEWIARQERKAYQLASERYQARCKSGYVMDSTGHECRRMARRGMLMCDECLAGVASSVVGSQGAGDGPRPVMWAVVTGVAMAVAVGLAMVGTGVW